MWKFLPISPPAFICGIPIPHAIIIVLNVSYQCSDKGYLVRILLAVLDHNHHVNRAFKQSSESDETSGETRQFHRVWRRRSNRWDAIPIKVDKDYAYIVEILKAVFALRYHAPIPLRGIERRKRVGSAITPQAPPDTSEIVRCKKSRFSSNSHD